MSDHWLHPDPAVRILIEEAEARGRSAGLEAAATIDAGLLVAGVRLHDAMYFHSNLDWHLALPTSIAAAYRRSPATPPPSDYAHDPRPGV